MKPTFTQIIFFLILILLILIIIYKVTKTNAKSFITKLIEQNTNLKIINKKNKNKNTVKGTIIVNNNAMFDKIATKGELGFAESYMDGDWDTEDL